MSDIFQDQHKATERKAKQADAAQQIVQRDARITASAAQRAKAAIPERPYIYSGPFWNQHNR